MKKIILLFALSFLLSGFTLVSHHLKVKGITSGNCSATNYVQVTLNSGEMHSCGAQAYTVNCQNLSDRPIKIYISIYDENGNRDRIEGGLYFKSIPPKGELNYKGEMSCGKKAANCRFKCHFADGDCKDYSLDYPQ